MQWTTKSRRTLGGVIVFWLLVAWVLFRPAAIWAILQGVGVIVRPFLFGLTIAFIVNLLLEPIERLWDRLGSGKSGVGTVPPVPTGWKRSLSVLLSVFLIVAVVFVLLFIVLPEVGRTFVVVADGAPQYIEQLQAWWEQLAEQLFSYGVVLPRPEANVEDLGSMVSEWVTEKGPAFLAKTLGFTSSVLTGAFNVIIGFVFALYVLADKERLGAQLNRLLHAFLPRDKADDALEVMSLTHSTFKKFVTGQLTDAFIVGLLCYIGMLVLRLPHAAAVSILVGATTIIPIVGVLLGTAVGAFLILVVDPLKALWFILFIVVLQQVESNFIYPKVVGKSVGLPGIWVLAAVTVGGITLGVPGMVLAVPIVSVLYVLLQRTVRRRLAEKRPFTQ